MKIVKPYARLMPSEYAPLGELSKIEWCGRVSHRSEDSASVDSWKRFVKAVVLDHGDWSIVEHASASVDMLVDRGVTHELVRHRLFSFTQESTRFVNYDKQKDGKPTNPPSFIYPKPDVECAYCLRGSPLDHYVGNGGLTVWYHSEAVKFSSVEDDDLCKYNRFWLDGIAAAERNYKGLIAEGWRPQEARSVFPNALAARIIVTGNLRNWRHLFIMRTTQEAHPQFRQVTIPLLEEFKRVYPLLFDDIEPMAKQSESMKKAR